MDILDKLRISKKGLIIGIVLAIIIALMKLREKRHSNITNLMWRAIASV